MPRNPQIKSLSDLLAHLMGDRDQDHSTHEQNLILIIELEHCDRSKGKYSYSGHTVTQISDRRGCIIVSPKGVGDTTITDTLALVNQITTAKHDVMLQWTCQNAINDLLEQEPEAPVAKGPLPS